MENKLISAGSGEKNSLIVCRNSQGSEVRATPLRMTRYVVVFEVYNPYSILQLSEVLGDFNIIINDRLVYSGRAVVSNLVNAGIFLICETTLEDAWLDVDLFSSPNQPNKLREEFVEFIKEWEKVHRVIPDFKVVVADMQTILMDLRRWMEQLELMVRSQPAGNRLQLERELIDEVQEPILPALRPLLERFEETARKVDAELQPVHRSYVKRQLHPLVLCSPFVFRTFQKPLGYAGDYEMVSMMLRDPHEGGSIFAKMLNRFFLQTPPVVAHRNRISYLHRQITKETARVARLGRRAQIFNLGCGPAREIQDFLTQDDLSDHAHFTLVDFNDETLAHVGKALEDLRQTYRRNTSLRFVKKSVHQILKESARPSPEIVAGGYDLVYCAGLFDYLSERICKRLMNIFFEMVAPGGLLVATNVDLSNPSRNWMEYVVDWHLVYRDNRQLAALTPDDAPAGSCAVGSDVTGVNIYLEIRKPPHA